jgi:hypothetical protein
MEDIAPFPYDLSDEQIILEVTSALQPAADNACEEYQTHRIAILAEVLYNLGFEFKRHNLIKLNRKKYRKECLHITDHLKNQKRGINHEQNHHGKRNRLRPHLRRQF